jgi:hypothetical protein
MAGHIEIGFYKQNGVVVHVAETLANGLCNVQDTESGRQLLWDKLPKDAIWLSREYTHPSVQEALAV